MLVVAGHQPAALLVALYAPQAAAAAGFQSLCSQQIVSAAALQQDNHLAETGPSQCLHWTVHAIHQYF